MTRTEHYEKNALVETPEETCNGDGKIDKWETYANGFMTSLAFDTQHRGTPERRFIYGPNGLARVEVVPTAQATLSLHRHSPLPETVLPI